MSTGFDPEELYFREDPSAPQRDEFRPFKEGIRSFINNFHIEGDFIYRTQINEEKGYLEIDLSHLDNFSEVSGFELIKEVNERPATAISLFEEELGIQVTLYSHSIAMPLRDLDSRFVDKLVHISAIVISSSKVEAKAKILKVKCQRCKEYSAIIHDWRRIGVIIPGKCLREINDISSTACPPGTVLVDPDGCEFEDSQVLKIQEDPEHIPPGEVPRHLIVRCFGVLANRITPGMRIKISGIYSIEKRGMSEIRTPYLHALGISIPKSGSITIHQEEEMREMAKDPNIYKKISSSISPAVYGYPDIKQALTCQLFGGVRREVNGSMLRGEINILLLGDPSTSKSQFLKFVSAVSPIGVYTSGKGSTAAGLTAAVIQDNQTRQFYLEGGAFVLADNGIVCIDEFDKMNIRDRVAIHEPMEQQTISIAKAGITAVLNARTAVLAAANPIFGVYDDLKTPLDNIDFQMTILSRFDLIFIVRDILDETRDRRIASHILSIHRTSQTENFETDISPEKLKQFISFARAECNPILSEEAAKELESAYVMMRQNQTDAVPITVRQLEAIIRISESLARLSLSNISTVEHVREALRLFKSSTIQAAGVGAPQLTREIIDQIERCELTIKRRLSIGNIFQERKLINILLELGYNEFAIRKAINIMIRREELEYLHQRRLLFRKK